MQDTGNRGAAAAPSTEGAVRPSTVDGEPFIKNPIGFDFVMTEIAARNPIVRQALTRRAAGWTG